MAFRYVLHQIEFLLVVLEVVPTLFHCPPGQLSSYLMKISTVVLKQSNKSGLFLSCPLIRAWVRRLSRLSCRIHVCLVISRDLTRRLLHQILYRGSLGERSLLIRGVRLELPRRLSCWTSAIVLALSLLERDLLWQLKRLACTLGHAERESLRTLLVTGLLHELVV